MFSVSGLGIRTASLWKITYDFFLRLYPAKPFSDDEAVRAVIEVLGEKNTAVKKFKPADFYDMQYLREIDQSGFIDKLYR